MNDERSDMDGWTVTIEAAGANDDHAVDLDALGVFADELANYSAVATAGSEVAPTRYGITMSIDGVGAVGSAVLDALDLFAKAVSVAGLPTWPIVRVDAMTYAEQDAEILQPQMPELVGVSEVAAILDVTRQRASELRSRQGFPAPVATLASGPVWLRPSLDRFVETWNRTAGRPRKADPPRTIEEVTMEAAFKPTPKKALVDATEKPAAGSAL